MSLTRIVRMTFRPDAVAAFRAVFEESKHRIRTFDGCLHLELWQDEADPHILITYSKWKSAAALEAYRESEVFRSTWTRTKVLFAAKPQAFSVQVIEVVG